MGTVPGDLAKQSGSQPAASAVEAQLQTIVSSRTFAQSPQLCRFLTFAVEQELAGKGDQLKEYVVAVQVLRKPESFDARVDTAVRTEALRLRQKLAEYYQTQGGLDPIEIMLPKGSYRPVFQPRLEADPVPAASLWQDPRIPRFLTASAAAAVLLATAGWWLWSTRSPTPPSVAIIPLENISGDAGQEYFSDGMTDALFTGLARFHGLSVISRTSTLRYKRTKKPLPEIARELKVDYIVEGSVVRAGDRVRITAQLIAARTDRHLWGESYERPLTDTLGMQAELAQAIASQVHAHLTPQEKTDLTGRQPDPQAQDLYLKGRFNWQTRDPVRLQQSIDYFNQAIARDPNYALPYVGLADAYAVLGYRRDRQDYNSRACAAARKAVQLEPNSAEAYAGLSQCADQWDWQQREESFRRAIDLSPSYSTAHQWYGAMLVAMGREKEGIAQLRRAVELDPLGPSANNELGFSLYLTRHYDQAIRQCSQTMEVFPGYTMPYSCLGFAYTMKGMHSQATAVMEKAVAIEGGSPPFAALQAVVLFRAGDRGAVPQLLREYGGRKVTPAVLAILYAVAGDRDRAFEWLDRAVAERSFASEIIAVHPALDSLHADPRWTALRRHMNLD